MTDIMTDRTDVPSDGRDIFVHTENGERVAYQAGQEIARMSRMTRERFYVDLQRWLRKNGERSLWLLDEKGNAAPAVDISAEIRKLQRERD